MYQPSHEIHARRLYAHYVHVRLSSPVEISPFRTAEASDGELCPGSFVGRDNSERPTPTIALPSSGLRCWGPTCGGRRQRYVGSADSRLFSVRPKELRGEIAQGRAVVSKSCWRCVVPAPGVRFTDKKQRPANTSRAGDPRQEAAKLPSTLRARLPRLDATGVSSLYCRRHVGRLQSDWSVNPVPRRGAKVRPVGEQRLILCALSFPQ
jgi:hypothetical protein